MDNQKNVRDFYEEEAKYEQSIKNTSEIIQKILQLDVEKFKNKIELVDSEHQFNEYIDLFNAVIGRPTNKYYFCKNIEDVKYNDLEMSKVYRIENLNIDLQSKNSKEIKLDLEARAILAEKLLELTNSLKEIFNSNLLKTQGTLMDFNQEHIIESDIYYLENLIKYIDLIIDKTGRLKVLVAERDAFALEEAKNQYKHKSSIEKWFYKALKKENSVINNLAKRNIEKK